jgi:hypothetical protein
MEINTAIVLRVLMISRHEIQMNYDIGLKSKCIQNIRWFKKLVLLNGYLQHDLVTNTELRSTNV